MRLRTTTMLLATVVAACSSSSPGTGPSGATGTATVTGTLGGAKLAAQDAVVVTGSSHPYVLIADFSGICDLGTSDLKKNTSGLDFNFNGPIKVGTFKAPAEVDVQYATYDSSCQSRSGESSTGGTVTITSVDSTGAKGSFKLTLNSDTISGSFDAAACTPAKTSGACL